MAHDVFISYSSKDKAVADAGCAVLEARGIRCWMAPRDILPGSEWGAAIVGAIGAARVMVLIYTSSSNASPQVRREVERAVARGLHVIPFRVEDVPMSPALEYFISSPHWLDALSPPLERHLDHLAKIIRAVLDAQNAAPAATAPGAPAAAAAAAAAPAPTSGWSHGPPPGAFAAQPVSAAPAATPQTTSGRTKLIAAVGALLLIVGTVAAVIVALQSGNSNNAAVGLAGAGSGAGTAPSPQPRDPGDERLKQPPPSTKSVRPPNTTPAKLPPTPPTVVSAPREPGDQDVKRFWELLGEGATRYSRIEELLDDYPQLANRPNPAGNTPLYEAAKAGHGHVVGLLLESGADRKATSTGKNTALHGAAAGGVTDAQVIQQLAPGNLDAVNDDGCTPLHLAVLSGRVDTARALAEADSDVNLPDKKGRTPLQIAVTLDDPGQARAMSMALVSLGAKCDVADKRSNTPLHFAAAWGDAALVSAMLDKGAKVDRLGSGGKMPLHLAVAAGKVDAVKALVARRAPLDAADDQGNTPLHLAAALPDTAVAEALLWAGAKVTTSTKEKLTPLHAAATSGNVKMVELLMGNGGAALIASGKPPTPIEAAEKAGKREVVALLRRLELPMMLQSAIKSPTQPIPPKLLEALRKDIAPAEAPDASGRNALHQCAALGNAALASELVKIKPSLVKLPLTPAEETPLHLAAQYKQAKVAAVLLRAGASVRATAQNDETALHRAARSGGAEVIKVLLDAGADPDSITRSGDRPRDLAPDAATKSLLAAAEKEAEPLRDAWASLELPNHTFDVTGGGLTESITIRFRDRTTFSLEGNIAGGFKSFTGTYSRGPLTLLLESPEGTIFPALGGTIYAGKVLADGGSFTLKIGATEIKFAGR